MTSLLPSILLLILPVCAQQSQWQISSSSAAVLAAESLILYRGGPAELKADMESSRTNDIIVVSAVEKEGLWSWTVLPLSTGTLMFVARYLAPDGKAVAAPSVSFHVTAAELPKEADISDIKGPLQAWPALWPWFLAAIVAFSARFCWKRWRRRPLAPAGALVFEALSPPEEVAARAIAELRACGLWNSNPAAYYLRLTDILRAYLEARYSRPVTAMTSVEVERLVKMRTQDLKIGGAVRELLNRADLVKFAKATPGPEEGPHDADSALSLIAATTPPVYASKEKEP